MVSRIFIWQDPAWPAFGLDAAAVAGPLAAARREQGAIVVLFRAIGLPAEAHVERDIWSGEALATAAIEGEKLDLQAVRSSVLRRLDIKGESKGRVNRHVDGLIDVMQDATRHFERPLGRAIVDMALAQDTRNAHRFYSLSRQLMEERGAYYDALNAVQRGTLDATPWIVFFLEQFRRSCLSSLAVIEAAVAKNRFWALHAGAGFNERQRKAVQRLLDAGPEGFEGGMTAEKYGRLTGASKATATRDLRQLLDAGVFVETGQGRGTRYWINARGWARS